VSQFQSYGRYPHNNIQYPVLKTALSRELVAPVVRHGDLVFAFRIIWRQTTESLEAAWDSVALQRRNCDGVMRAQPNIEFFVSSITGVFTKSATKGANTAPIFPAISYWVATTLSTNDGECEDMYWRIIHQLQGLCADAELKPIKAQTRRFKEVDACISASLYVVLKDHRSGYIRWRVDRSLSVLGDVSEARAPARIVVMPSSKYREHIMNAEHTLSEASLCSDFLVADNTHLEG